MSPRRVETTLKKSLPQWRKELGAMITSLDEYPDT